MVKAARVGFTTLLTGALGSYIVNEPSPILALLPTESDCRHYMVMDVEPIFEVTPALKGMLESSNEVGERNTLLSRRFPGGALKIVAAKAPRNLRRHTARILMIDEADAMEVGAEGDPIKFGRTADADLRQSQDHHWLDAGPYRHEPCAPRLQQFRPAGL
jgi:phage terminase large subunit GpA-like protein